MPVLRTLIAVKLVALGVIKCRKTVIGSYGECIGISDFSGNWSDATRSSGVTAFFVKQIPGYEGMGRTYFFFVLEKQLPSQL